MAQRKIAFVWNRLSAALAKCRAPQVSIRKLALAALLPSCLTAAAQTADQAWLRHGHFHGLPPVPLRVQALGREPLENVAVKELVKGIDHLYGSSPVIGANGTDAAIVVGTVQEVRSAYHSLEVPSTLPLEAFWIAESNSTGKRIVVIAGGSEATFSPGILMAWESMRVVSPTVCRPFSRDRNGMMLGEGGAIMVIESLEHAEARGAKPLAEIAGVGMSSDAHHVTQPSAEGAARAITRALKDAGIGPEQVGYVNAHGTGTTVNDATETRALHQAFGDHAARLAVSSTKSMHGHTLGAAGAIESAAAILALRNGFLPPTIHYNERDPECDLDYVPNQVRAWDGEYAMSNSFAFGGLNAVLVLRRL